jgi:hypothetical protein
MAYIYKITNQVNGKIYIGKTEFSVEKRFAEHCKDAFRERNEKRPLYAAMQKYGTQSFKCETIEETDMPVEREIFWIEFYRSFKYGYNATLGGDGKRYLDYDLIIATYKEVQNVAETARKLDISPDSVHNVLKNFDIDILPSTIVSQVKLGKVVNQYDLDGNFIQSFPSAKSAAESLNKITATSNGASSHITQVCKGKRKTAYGYKWGFAD